MKKIFFLFFVLGVFRIFPSSPNYTLTPGPSIEDTANFNTLSIYDIYQVNVSNASIELNWQLISTNIPAGWDYSMCELGTCFPGIPNGGTMDSVVAGDMGFLGLNINPYFIPGTAVVKVFVYETGFFNQGDTLTWVIHAVVTSLKDLNLSGKIQLFPNPTTTSIQIKTSENLQEFNWQIFDCNGSLLKSGYSENKEIVLDDMSAGKYFLVPVVMGRRLGSFYFIKTDD